MSGKVDDAAKLVEGDFADQSKDKSHQVAGDLLLQQVLLHGKADEELEMIRLKIHESHHAEKAHWPARQVADKRVNKGFVPTWKIILTVIVTIILWPLLTALLGIMSNLATVAFALIGWILVFYKLYLDRFLPHNDYFTKLLLLGYKFGFHSKCKNGVYPKPTAKEVFKMDKLRKIYDDHPEVETLFALENVAYATALKVPFPRNEDFQKPRAKPSLLEKIMADFHKLPDDESWKDWGEWSPDENPIDYVMENIGDCYPEMPEMLVRDWAKDKKSDEALTHFVKEGLAMHRIERVREDDRFWEPELESFASEKETLHYVVRTNAMAPLETRKGLERYGGDCYFDKDWRVVKIVRLEMEDMGRVPNRRPIYHTYRPGDTNWEYIKFCFRSSVAVLVTLVDHLYGIHLQAANILCICNRQNLGHDHPVRRFLVPFTYRSITVNSNAKQLLVNPNSLAPRSFALTNEGLQVAWAACPSLLRAGNELKHHPDEEVRSNWILYALSRDKYYTYLQEKEGIHTEYNRQGIKFWRILRVFVEDFMKLYYPDPLDAWKDKDLDGFVRNAFLLFDSTNGLDGQAIMKHVLQDEPRIERLWNAFIDLITMFLFNVTAQHEHVGNISEYTQDPSFVAGHWPVGQAIGTKRCAILQATLMAFTSTPMPGLKAEPGTDEDWTFCFISDKDNQNYPLATKEALSKVFTDFQNNLKDFAAEVREYNEKAPERAFPDCWGIYCYDPEWLECSVSV